MKLRVLVLDDYSLEGPAQWLEWGDVKLDVTCLEQEEIANAYGHFISARGRVLASRAEDYDLVVVGNNQGTGMVYARDIPYPMRKRTLIIWNESNPSDEEVYAELGYRAFAARGDEGDWFFEQVKNLVTQAPN